MITFRQINAAKYIRCTWCVTALLRFGQKWCFQSALLSMLYAAFYQLNRKTQPVHVWFHVLCIIQRVSQHSSWNLWNFTNDTCYTFLIVPFSFIWCELCAVFVCTPYAATYIEQKNDPNLSRYINSMCSRAEKTLNCSFWIIYFSFRIPKFKHMNYGSLNLVYVLHFYSYLFCGLQNNEEKFMTHHLPSY